MKFYRLATHDDFKTAEAEFNEAIPLSVRTLFGQNDLRGATKRWREHSGLGMQTVMKKFQEYAAFRQAFSDFLAGKPVYTEY